MDLQTRYLGINLKNPLIVSSCRLSEEITNIKQMETAGAAAVVMYSIFAEEINYDNSFVDYFTKVGADSFGEALTYFPNLDKQKDFLDKHLLHLQKAVAAVKIPIIGSLNAVSESGWLDYAIRMQETGIQALEINLHNLSISHNAPQNIEQDFIKTVAKLKANLKIPVAVKLHPFFTSIADLALRLEKEAKIDGLVLFNRFYYPDIDIERFAFINDIQLSNSYEMRLPLKWIMLLRSQLKVSLAGSSGIHTASDIIKYLLTGANAVMCAACLMQNGIDYSKELLQGVEDWLKNHKFESIQQINRLLNKDNTFIKNEFERAYYLSALRSWQQKDLQYTP